MLIAGGVIIEKLSMAINAFIVETFRLLKTISRQNHIVIKVFCSHVAKNVILLRGQITPLILLKEANMLSLEYEKGTDLK
ncbi:MAG: hypothetical protein EB015_11720 [Methylocystaceae bacterium]|nr:hypothetical protein [Methylocystaceae bacterium]